MRTLIIALVFAATIPAFAAGWSHYDNTRFGYGIDIPPDFDALGESDNGDGQAFERGARAQKLLVWGGFTLDGFEAEVAARMGYATADGWTISYQATTPQWASFSGSIGQRIFYQRMISLCGGSQYAAFAVEYSQIDVAKMDEVVGTLVKSLRGSGAC
ncbi:hypothetical protein [Devosia sp.]|uniref:hypothetical protein n=1 Tax=Devosia sp. TaxID=1871048 RepID=UPI003262F2AE